MIERAKAIARKHLNKEWEALHEVERHVLTHIAGGEPISRKPAMPAEEKLTLGQRLADRVAAFGGSWPFIILFLSVLAAWVVLNSIVLARYGKEFDPFPYILLNLFLSMLASLQAPIIMMSQNRLSEKDREQAMADYEVNLKSELEIRMMHDKIDELVQKRWEELLVVQEQQIDLLKKLSAKAK